MLSVARVVAKVLGLDPRKVTDDVGPDNTDSWDSFNGLMLATELEKNFNVTFTLDELAGVKSVGDIKKTLKKHGIEA